MKNLILTFIFLIGVIFNSFTQCSTIFTSALPTTAQNAGTAFTSQAGKYAILNVTAGNAYEIESSLTTQNFCVREGSYNGTIVAQGGMNGTGIGLVYVAQTTGLAYIHIYTQACNTATNNRTITITDITTSYTTTNSITYNQGFNSTTIPVGNWYGYSVNMGATAARITGLASGSNPTSTPQEGTNYIRFNSYICSSGASARLVSPAISTVGTSSVDVEYYWGHDNNYSTANDNVQLQYSTNGSTWINVGSVNPRYLSTANASVTWTKYTITLPSGAANQSKIYVAFLFTSAFGAHCSLDNVIVKPTPSCVIPTALSSSNITTTTATISWTAPSSPPADGYDYYLSTTNTPPTAGTTPTGSVNAGVITKDLTNLSTCTSYYIWVRSKCSSSETSSWSTTFNFITSTEPGTISANKTLTVVNDAVTFTTNDNVGTISKFEWSFNNFTTVAGTVNNPANPYTLILNVQQPNIWFRTTTTNTGCSPGVTSPVNVTLISAPPFVYGTQDGDYISNVVLNTINNNSTYDPPLGDSYQNFTNLSTTLVAGSTYTISVSSPQTFAGMASGYAAWIDFNNNGIFESSENIMQQPYGQTRSQSFTVPSNATMGDVLMRVISVWGGTPSNDAYYALGYDFGEIEEYRIFVSVPLPVELSKFDGINKNNDNYLFWITSTEHNTSYFNLQKSRDGETWFTISTINAAGSSTSKIDYNVIDYNVDPIINYYRLVQYDSDGSYETFGPIAINNMNLISTKTILKYVNLNGQEIDPEKLDLMDIYIEIYTDGTMKKVIK